MIWIGHSHGGVSVANVNKIDSDIRTLYFEDQKKDDLLELFPNPIVDAFYIKFSDSTISPIKITVFDIAGKLLHQNQILSETTEQQYLFLISELNILNNGIYIIQVQTNKGMYSKRVLVII